ncbi:MAG: VCBS repeat-containing protein [Planctomycetes bacterium]|nr:VCBS repeat-containing protein [Planctomycetota bacterium]
MSHSRSLLVALVFSSASSIAVLGQGADPQPPFAPAQQLSPRYAFTRLADWNGDAVLDLIGGENDLRLYLQLGAGGGLFVEPPATLPFTAVRRIGTGDLDGDGDLDLVAARYADAAQILWNDGSASFTAGPTLAFSGVTGSDPEIADFDGDGRADIALLSSSTGVAGTFVQLFFDDGSLAYAATASVILSSRASALASIELDGRAPRELVASTSSGALLSLASNGGRSFVEASIGAATYGTRIEQVVDLDRDGREDLVLSGLASSGSGFATNGVSLAYGNGSGGIRDVRVLYAGSNLVQMAHAGAFDATGSLDIAVAFAGELLLWTSRSSIPAEVSLPAYRVLGSSPSAATVGDLDGDGDLDLLGRDDRFLRARIWQNRARFELRVPFDETVGSSVWDAAQPDGRGQRLQVLGNALWQGDPGLGREAFRGNDAGTGMLARGSNAWLANNGIPGGPPVSASGSCTIAWWQRMGGTGPQQYVELLNAAGFQVLTGVAPQTDRLVVLRDPAIFPNGLPPLVSATSISAPNRWLHIAIAFDAATRQVQLYFDGSADGAPVPAGTLPQGGLQVVSLGAPTYGAPATTWFDLDELRYIPRRLSSAEIPGLLRGQAITVASLGDGCFERRATEGLHVQVGARAGSFVTLELDTTGLTSGAAVIAFGLSSAQLGGLPLPLDLGFGCLLRTSLEVLIPWNVGALATLSVPLPVAPGALQGHLYAQGLILGVGLQTTRAFNLKLHY